MKTSIFYFSILYLTISVNTLLGQNSLITYIDKPDLTEDQVEIVQRFERVDRLMDVYYVEIESMRSVEDSGRISILLPDEVTEFTFNARYVKGDSLDYTWYGIIDGHNDTFNIHSGALTFLEHNGQKFGYFYIDSVQYEIHDIGDNLNILLEYESGNTLCDIDTSSNPIINNSIETRSCPDLAEVDVLVVWTRRGAIEILGNSTNVQQVIENTIRTGIAMGNVALINSSIKANQVRFNLVGMEEVPFEPTGFIKDDLEKIVNSTTDEEAVEIRHLRDEVYEADIVMVLVEESYTSSRGAVLEQGIQGSDDHAYGIIHTVDALQNHIMVHEMSHLFGCQHQQCSLDAFACDDDNPAISHGYQFNVGGFLGLSNRNYKTIMNVSDRTTIPHFSNPNVKYKRHRTGASGTNNNAQQILNESCDVSEYRGDIGFIVGIDLHTTDCASQSRVVKAVVSGGGPSYTYYWQTSVNGFVYSSSIGSSVTQQITIPSGVQGLFVKLTVTSGSVSYTAVRFLEPCSVVITPYVSSDSEILFEEIFHEDIHVSVYPNPNNEDMATIKVMLEKEAIVSVHLISMDGSKIKGIIDDRLPAGVTELAFDNINLIPSLYFIRLTTHTGTKIVKYFKL